MQRTRTAIWRIREPRGSSLVELMLSCAVITILVTRAYLALTGYPQIGGSLHIAHMLWGGLLMLIAALILFQAADRICKPVVAILFGAGFGLFLDEIGKFVTRDNNYFFKPSVAIMYVVIILILLSTRFIARIDKRPKEEALYFATETLARAWMSGITTAQREAALQSIILSGITSSAVTSLRSALKNAPTSDESHSRSWRTWDEFWSRCQTILAGKRFQQIIFALIITYVVTYASTLLLIRRPVFPHNFIEWLNVAWQTAVALLLLSGIIAWLRHRQFTALKLFYYAMLIMLLIGQVFTFANDEFYGLIDLTINIAILLGLRGTIESQTAKASTTSTNNSRFFE